MFVNNGFIIELWLTFISQEDVLTAYVVGALLSLRGYILLPVAGYGSNVPIDTSFGLVSYMLIDYSRLADSDSFAFLGNSRSIISDLVVRNDCILSVDPVWLTGIVVGVGWETSFDSYCFLTLIFLSSMNTMSRLLTTFLSTRSHSL